MNSGSSSNPRNPGPLLQGRNLCSLLVFACIGAFLLVEYYTDNRLSRIQWVYGTFALSMDGLKRGCVWQLVTYMFLHGGYLHLGFNCVVLYFVGGDVERFLGKMRFLLIYFGGGVVGGLAQCAAGFIPGERFGVIVGASAGLMALMGAVSVIFWRNRLRLLVMFVIPVSLTGRGTLILLTLFDVAGAILQRGPFAHYGHLGGLYTGFLLMRYLPSLRPAGVVMGPRG